MSMTKKDFKRFADALIHTREHFSQIQWDAACLTIAGVLTQYPDFDLNEWQDYINAKTHSW